MRRVGLVGLGFVALAVSAARGEPALREAFEGPATSWLDAGGDMHYRIEAHGRVQGVAHSGDWCEQLRVVAQNGTFVFIRHDIGKAPVIDELVPTVWLRSDRAGLQILARVVLPRTLDPRTSRPLTTLLRGTTYSDVGGWQQLRIDETPQRLERQARILRSQLGTDIDTGEAYIDAVLLNVYGGEGTTQVGIDDLEVTGLVDRPVAESQGVVRTAGQEPLARRRVELSGSLLLVEGRPFFPRVVQYHGESLPFLKQLGFNAVWLSEPPGRELRDEAARLGLWLVSPPPFPPSEGSSPLPLPNDYDGVLAWDLGAGLTGRDVPRVQAWAQQLRKADQVQGRPLVASADAQLRTHSRHCDILRLSRYPLGTSLELVDYGVWLRERPRLARPGTPCWTTIQTSLAPALVEQWDVLAAQDRPSRGPHLLECETLRLLVYTALAAGARGLVFESPGRLDDPQAPDAVRLARAFERTNQELDLVEPWAAAGKPLATVDSSLPEIMATLLQSDRARLLLVQTIGRHDQYVPGQSAAADVSFVVPAPETHKPYEITPGGLRPLRHVRATGGMRVTLSEFGLTALVLLTQDPLVVSGMSARLAQTARRAAQLERELAAARLADLTAWEPQLKTVATGVPRAAAWLAAARADFDRCDQALTRGDFPLAALSAQRSMRPLRLLQRACWDQVVGPLPSPTSSPLAANFWTLADQRRFAERAHSASRAPNVLPAGDFEDLSRMLDGGWRHVEHAQPNVQTEAELSPVSPHGGQFSLRVKAASSSEDALAGFLETPPIWIVSPALPVTRGQVWRIHGWVRVSAPVTGSVDGVLIFDSLSGEALAERIQRTDGWQEFSLYRAAPRSGEWELTFALTGLGEFWLDDVSAELVELGGAGTSVSARLTP